MDAILAATTESGIQDYLCDLLRCRGANAEFVRNHAEALQRLDDTGNRFSLVLVDILAPQRDCVEALRAIRSLCPGLPIIVISRHPPSIDLSVAMRNGPVEFLTKPVEYNAMAKA